MYLNKTIYNRSVKQILITDKMIDEMADHLTGKRLSAYREDIYDADGDGKVTLKDFIHRIKNLAGAESNIKIEPAPTTTGGGY